MNTLPQFFFIVFCSLFCFSMSLHGDENREDFDLDDDGLIEINSLEDLDEIRNNLSDLPIDRFGKTLYGKSTGCPDYDGEQYAGCTGYELTKNLDFDTNGNGIADDGDDYWNEGEGWEPIGNSSASFSGSFNGNGYVITSLYVNRLQAWQAGLFGSVEMASINALGVQGYVTGYREVGGVVGKVSMSSIESVFFVGRVKSSLGSAYRIGGLFGEVYKSRIVGVYAAGRVENSNSWASGLVGELDKSILKSSYSAMHVYTTDFLYPLLTGNSLEVKDSFWLTSLDLHTDREIPNELIKGEEVELDILLCSLTSNSENCIQKDAVERLSLYKKEDGQKIWDFGTDRQLPGLNMGERIYRDSDSDGIFDHLDAFPNQFGAWIDADSDGAPDRWNKYCDSECRIESGLVLDAFPEWPQAYLDADYDGLPDAWTDQCINRISQCESETGLVTDVYENDTDNDGISDALDDDDNGDGIKDVDSDSDGLIEIANLDELNAIRFQIDGQGYRADEESELDVSGCPWVIRDGDLVQRCSGYELEENLTFDTNDDGQIDENDAYWNEGLGWEPIGNTTECESINFNGNGFSIDFLHINRKEEAGVGLFSCVTGSIRELNMHSASVSADRRVGLLSGTSKAGSILEIDDVRFDGEVKGGGSVGGFIGYAEGRLEFSQAYMSGLIDGSVQAGGYVGYSKASILVENSVFQGEVKGSWDLGGLIGEIDIYWRDVDRSTVIRSSYIAPFMNAKYTLYRFGYVGGIVGDVLSASALTIENSILSPRFSEYVLNSEIWIGVWAGKVSQSALNIIESYWVSDLSGLNPDDHGSESAISLLELMCVDGTSKDDCSMSTQFNSWPKTPEDSEIYWDFSNSSVMPSLNFVEMRDRDDDGDGIRNSIDIYPNDSDNDGIPNSEDRDWSDNGNPVITKAPATKKISAEYRRSSGINGGYYSYEKVVPSSRGIEVEDALSKSFNFELFYKDEKVTKGRYGSFNEMYLRPGRHVFKWIAIDQAGNQSEPVEQIIDIYPAVYFEQDSSEVGEPGLAEIKVKLTGSSPEYPVEIELEAIADETTLDQTDIDQESSYKFNLTSKQVLNLEVGSDSTLNKEVSLFIPIAKDGIADTDEKVSLKLNGVILTEGEENLYRIIDEASLHALTVTESNLPPNVKIELWQDELLVKSILKDKGEVIVKAVVTDPNSEDTHSLEWDLASLDLGMATESEWKFDPAQYEEGRYQISISALDSGGLYGSQSLSMHIKTVPSETPTTDDNQRSSEGGSDNSGAGTFGFWVLILWSMTVLRRKRYKNLAHL